MKPGPVGRDVRVATAERNVVDARGLLRSWVGSWSGQPPKVGTKHGRQYDQDAATGLARGAAIHTKRAGNQNTYHPLLLGGERAGRKNCKRQSKRCPTKASVVQPTEEGIKDIDNRV